jgi:hypothetical protein
MIDLETSIHEFLNLGRDLQRSHSSAEDALMRLVDWYASTRIEDAELDEDGDMLLLQWGSTKPFRFTEPTDLRQVGDHEMGLREETNYLFIDLTRQVFARAPGSEAEFDDSAVQMSITLCYQPGAPDHEGSDIWIPTPGDVEASLAKFRSVPLVSALLSKPVARTVVTVGLCG